MSYINLYLSNFTYSIMVYLRYIKFCFNKTSTDYKKQLYY